MSFGPEFDMIGPVNLANFLTTRIPQPLSSSKQTIPTECNGPYRTATMQSVKIWSVKACFDQKLDITPPTLFSGEEFNVYGRP